jgi:hypothetical protein
MLRLRCYRKKGGSNVSKSRGLLCVVCFILVSVSVGGCSLLKPPPGFPTEPVVFLGEVAVKDDGNYSVGLSIDENGTFPILDGMRSSWWYFGLDIPEGDPNAATVTWTLDGIVAGEYYIGIRLRSGDYDNPEEHYRRLVNDSYSMFLNGTEIDIHSASEIFVWDIADWGGATVLAVAQSEDKIALKNGDRISVTSYAAHGMVYNLILYPEDGDVNRVWFPE